MPESTTLPGNLSAHAHGGGLMMLMVLTSALLAAVVAALCMPLRPEHLRRHPMGDFAALLGLGLLVPVFGPLLTLGAMLLFRRLQHRQAHSDAEHLPPPPFVPATPQVPVRFGVGGAIRGLREHAFGTDKSIRALMAIEQRRSAQTSQFFSKPWATPTRACA